VLGTAHQLLGRKVDMVGMDACLMTMLEVAYQIRDHAEILVGSEPGDGRPYDTVLRDLAARPGMTARDLAATIVRR
jgi:cysteine peptidase C11 family protein